MRQDTAVLVTSVGAGVAGLLVWFGQPAENALGTSRREGALPSPSSETQPVEPQYTLAFGGAMPGAFKNKPFPAVTQDAAGFALLGFEHLASFPFVPLEPEKMSEVNIPGRLPETIRKLDGRRVGIAGFMLPFKFVGGQTTEFLIVSSQMVCCYGMQPEPNEWVVVRVNHPGLAVRQDCPMRFYGTLRVRETYEGGFFSSLYELECEKAALLR